MLADNGYANGDEVAALAESDIEALVATGSSGRRRRYDFRPAKTEVPVKKPKAEWLKVMAAKLDSEEGRALYRLRQQTVEPVFGIIKAALGFTGFSPATKAMPNHSTPNSDPQVRQTASIRRRGQGGPGLGAWGSKDRCLEAFEKRFSRSAGLAPGFCRRPRRCRRRC